MYDFIRGTIVQRQPNNLVVECNGVGYKILSAPEFMNRYPARGETAMIFTYLYVREDTMALYGFPGIEDRNLFELLLSVSGIGPKVASAIVGALPPSQFAMAVLSGDTKTLTQVRGIGRKGAERLILEMKDKLKGAEIPDVPVSGMPAAAGGEQSIQQEAISALVVLGYNGSEAARAVFAVKESVASLEDLIRLALRQLMR